MSHVSTTAHYNLPIYGGNDIINPLTDVNGTNEAVDTAIYEVSQALASGVTDITDIKNKVGDASLDTASQTLSGAINELKGVNDAQTSDITDIEANVSTLQTQMSTATGNITTLNTTVAGLQTEVSGKASQSAVNTLATKVGSDALITTADDLSGAVNELKNDIDNIDANIDKLVPTRTADVIVTGNGVKTLAQCFTELADGIDFSKITPFSKLQMNWNGIMYNADVASYYTNGLISGTIIEGVGTTSSCIVRIFQGAKTGSSYTSNASYFTLKDGQGAAKGDDSSTVVNNGDTFKFYY